MLSALTAPVETAALSFGPDIQSPMRARLKAAFAGSSMYAKKRSRGHALIGEWRSTSRST
jgi:hypothetical protein